VFQSSNIYNGFHIGYGDMGLFGQSMALLVEDEDEVLRMQSFMHGQFWIARDEKGRVTTMYRRFRWSVQRIVGRFGYKNVERVAKHVTEADDRGKYDDKFDVWHAVEPRLERKRNSPARHD